MIQLTPLQARAATAAIQSLLASEEYILTGYAGTGKTTLLSYINETLTKVHNKRPLIMAPTGKAAQVLRSKGLTASTIHSALYKKISDSPLRFARREADEISSPILIVDESSMIDKQILKDLRSFQKPILFVGDPFQLPPVGDDPKLLADSHFCLTEVHRQALDNPIISLATFLRSDPSSTIHKWAKDNRTQSRVKILPKRGIKIDPNLIDQAICGYNTTRTNVNSAIRKRLGFSGIYPNANERLICLRNDYDHGVVNGQQFIADTHCDDTGEIDVFDPSDPDTIYELQCFLDVFTSRDPKFNPKACARDLTPLDYSYCITCHKSQGSEFPTVAVIDEPIGDTPNRWRYTAVTRAMENLYYFI